MPDPAELGLPALLSSSLLALLLFLQAARRADWQRLVGDGRLNLWLGTTVVVLLLWRLRGGAHPGLDLHLIGATTVWLMFGLRLSLVSLGLAAIGAGLAAGSPLLTVGLHWLQWGVVPLLASAWLISWAERRLPAHLFVFLWGYGFVGSALAVAASAAVQGLVLGAAGADWARLGSEYLAFFILLGWSEAFTAGALLTLMVIWRPGWVAHFDDSRYLRNRD